LGIEIDLEISMPESLTSFESMALESLYSELVETEVKLNRKGTRGDTKEKYQAIISEVNSSIKTAKGLGASIAASAIDYLKKQAETNENKRLAAMAENRVKRSDENKAVKALEKSGMVFDISKYV